MTGRGREGKGREGVTWETGKLCTIAFKKYLAPILEFPAGAAGAGDIVISRNDLLGKFWSLLGQNVYTMLLSRCRPAKNSNIEDDLEEILIFPLFVMFQNSSSNNL